MLNMYNTTFYTYAQQFPYIVSTYLSGFFRVLDESLLLEPLECGFPLRSSLLPCCGEFGVVSAFPTDFSDALGFITLGCPSFL